MQGNREYFKLLGGKIFRRYSSTRKKGYKRDENRNRGIHDFGSIYLSQYDWLKGSHMTKVVWLLNETLIIHTANLWRQIFPIQRTAEM